MNKTETKLKEAVKDLLAEEKVSLVVGYEKGTLPLRSRPCFIRSGDEVDRLTWDSFCSDNLAVYLPGLFERPANPRQEYAPPKVGIVAKGCDLRSVVGLVKEHQVPRENVVIIGIPCQGVVDSLKVEALLDRDGVSRWEADSEGAFHITTRSGKTSTIKRDDVIAASCLECAHPSPEGADVLIEGESKSGSGKRYDRVKEFEAKSPQERWQYFVEEISKCIRCYACRQACPNCYCKVCFADQTKPRWIGASDEFSDVVVYHIGRIFHQAGRCVQCDACVRACPMGIDLALFTRQLGKAVEELFGCVPGLSEEELPPLCTFREDDSENFITEP